MKSWCQSSVHGISIIIGFNDNNIFWLTFDSDPKELFNFLKVKDLPYLENLQELSSYPLEPRGTEFQRSVWDALLKIPKGQTSTYSAIAKEIGRPNSYRAVGNAVGKNPISYLIPCHRVIRADGRLGGFSGGIEIKKILLKNELIKK